MLVPYMPRGCSFANVLVCVTHLTKEYTPREVCFSLYTPKADIVSLERTRTGESLSGLKRINGVRTLLKSVWVTEDKSRDLHPNSLLLGLGGVGEGYREDHSDNQRHRQDQQEEEPPPRRTG
jgi:hypothetical protein